MRPRLPRFTIRWLMEATIIVGIALWSLRFSRKTWSAIVLLLVVYVCGLDPMRRLYGFSPLRRYFARFATGHMGVGPDGRSRQAGEMRKA